MRTYVSLNVSSVVNDPVARELDRLGVKVSLLSERLTLPAGRTLSRSEETAVKQRRGQAVRRGLERLMDDPRYARLNDAGRVRVIEKLLPRVREQAGTTMRRELSATRGQ